MAESQDIELILPDEEVDPRAADVIQESGGEDLLLRQEE